MYTICTVSCNPSVRKRAHMHINVYSAPSQVQIHLYTYAALLELIGIF